MVAEENGDENERNDSENNDDDDDDEDAADGDDAGGDITDYSRSPDSSDFSLSDVDDLEILFP